MLSYVYLVRMITHTRMKRRSPAHNTHTHLFTNLQTKIVQKELFSWLFSLMRSEDDLKDGASTKNLVVETSKIKNHSGPHSIVSRDTKFKFFSSLQVTEVISYLYVSYILT